MFMIFEDKENEIFVINADLVIAIKINADSTDTIFTRGGVDFQGNLLGACERLSDAMNAANSFADPNKVDN